MSPPAAGMVNTADGSDDNVMNPEGVQGAFSAMHTERQPTPEPLNDSTLKTFLVHNISCWNGAEAATL